MHVRCVTLNVKGMEHWEQERLNVALRGLQLLQPDILCFQETTIRNSSPPYDQAQELADGLGLAATAFSPYGNPVEVQSEEQGGVAISSRWPIHTVRGRRLPPGLHEDERTTLLVELSTPEGRLEVCNTHLSWRPDEEEVRCLQVEVLMGEFERAHWDDPLAKAILCGDFNATQEEKAIGVICEHLKDTYREIHPDEPGHTWTVSNPWVEHPDGKDRRLDYIFCPKGVQVIDARVVLDQPDPVFASDHYGVLAELEW